MQILEEICETTRKQNTLPMRLMQYLIGELSYGGKLINEEDKDILKHTVTHFINQNVIDKSGLIIGAMNAKHYQMHYA